MVSGEWFCIRSLKSGDCRLTTGGAPLVSLLRVHVGVDVVVNLVRLGIRRL